MSCWLSTLTPNAKGYVYVSEYIDGTQQKYRLHRVMYENFVGEITDGMVIDHLCRTRNCINPEHLQAVSSGENTFRGVGMGKINALKTHCPSGHEYNEANTKLYRGTRICRACVLIKSRARYAN